MSSFDYILVFFSKHKNYVYEVKWIWISNNNIEQAGAELCQAHIKLG